MSSFVDPTSIRGLLERVRAVHIGVDLGQAQDFSAIAVVEVGERATQRSYRVNGRVYAVPESTYRVQRLMRLDLGTSWHEIAAKVVQLVGDLWDWERGLREKGELQPHEPQLPWDIWADATGVGKPVMEMISNGLQATTKTDRAQLHPVVFTHGDRFDRAAYQGTVDRLGKAYLVSRLQVLAQAEPPLLRLPPRDPEAAAMMQELKDYRIKVDEDANDKYGAFTTGAHDDLVTALGLACIEDPGYYSVEAAPSVWGSDY
jgi:hypothetical protein